MLQNRIAMLEIEEQKMMKKINETRKRAEQITKIKQDNEERFLSKLRYQREQEEALEQFRQQNNDQREQQKKRKFDNMY